MKILLDNNTTDYRITAYGPGSITINEEIIKTPVIIHAGGFRLWQTDPVDTLTEKLILATLEDKPNILLLGTGAQQKFPDPELIKPIIESGTGFEVMDTAAACRTYNLLVSEGRHVVATLLPILISY